jgi:hypothetical protein
MDSPAMDAAASGLKAGKEPMKRRGEACLEGLKSGKDPR